MRKVPRSLNEISNSSFEVQKTSNYACISCLETPLSWVKARCGLKILIFLLKEAQLSVGKDTLAVKTFKKLPKKDTPHRVSNHD